METVITATQLARNLSDILNRARYQRERFRVERNGEVIAVIEPPPEPDKFTIADLIELWKSLPPVDDKFVDDLEAVHEAQGFAPAPPEWPS